MAPRPIHAITAPLTQREIDRALLLASSPGSSAAFRLLKTYTFPLDPVSVAGHEFYELQVNTPFKELVTRATSLETQPSTSQLSDVVKQISDKVTVAILFRPSERQTEVSGRLTVLLGGAETTEATEVNVRMFSGRVGVVEAIFPLSAVGNHSRMVQMSLNGGSPQALTTIDFASLE